MSVTTLGATLPAVPIAEPKTRWFKAPDAEDDPENPRDFDNWPRAARRLWKIILRRLRKTGAKMIFDPVWKLANLCGRCERWVWKALAQLQELGVIRRFWCDGRKEVENRKGHHGEVGRATEINIDLAGPEPKAKPPAKGKAKDKPAAQPATGTGAMAKIKATIAQAEAEKAANPPGETPSPSQWDWRKAAEAQRQALGLPETPAGREPTGADLRRRREEECLARLKAKLESGEPLDQPPADPAGPEVPAPESGS